MDYQHHQHQASETEMHNHDKHAGHSVAMFKDKFWLSLILTVPVLIYSEMIQYWFNFSPPNFLGANYVPFIFSTIIFFYGGSVFIKSARAELKAKRPGMMTLISLAIITAYFYSVLTQFVLGGESFFWELATLVTIMLLGHWLEMASVAKAESALESLTELLPDMTERLVSKKPVKVLVSQLKVGDFILVRPGGRVPIDGTIVSGNSTVNESALTGESKPVVKAKGDNVIAGTTNQEGSLIVKVSKIGDDTTLAGIMQLVSEASKSKSNTQVLADKAAFGLTIIAILTSVATFVFWLMAKDASFALERAVTVLIIACPHALGLAIPLVVSISSAISARDGLLVRKRLALESAHKLDYVLFDKTGTLTEGEHSVIDIWASKGYTKKNILQLTASLEQYSEHIVGRAIVNKANDKQLKLLPINDFKALPGIGVSGKLENRKRYLVVGLKYVKEHQLNVPDDAINQIKLSTKQGKMEVYLIKSNKVIGTITLEDEIRQESKSTILELNKLGIKTAMITGDSNQVAEYVADKLNISQFYSEVLPKDKSKIIKQLQKQGSRLDLGKSIPFPSRIISAVNCFSSFYVSLDTYLSDKSVFARADSPWKRAILRKSSRVAFVGDGINDAPALAQADIGLAIGAGTDIAIKSADVILVNSNPKDVLRFIELSRATYKKMVQNLIWATGYNVLAIPLAAGVLSFRGILLSPAVGAVLMTLSTIVVAVNAQLLKRV